MQPHKHSRRRREPLPPPSVVDVDPGDPTQQLDEAGEFHITPLEVEALPAAEGDADVDLAIELAEEEDDTQSEDEELGLEPAEPPTADELAAAEREDEGDLYGVHVPRAVDTDVAPDDASQSSDGETWTEELLARAAESGAMPERELDVVEEDEKPHWGHHGTESGDRPVADKGSGGPGGL